MLIRVELCAADAKCFHTFAVMIVAVGLDERVLNDIMHAILLFYKVADLVEHIQERSSTIPRGDCQDRALLSRMSLSTSVGGRITGALLLLLLLATHVGP